MRFNCGPTALQRAAARRNYLENWHEWFAWMPVRLNNRECAWLETVLRKGTFHTSWEDWWWEWEYLPHGTVTDKVQP